MDFVTVDCAEMLGEKFFLKSGAGRKCGFRKSGAAFEMFEDHGKCHIP